MDHPDSLFKPKFKDKKFLTLNQISRSSLLYDLFLCLRAKSLHSVEYAIVKVYYKTSDSLRV